MEHKDLKQDFGKLDDVLFISGIGTDIGKSWATGWMAREIAKGGGTVITQKFIQTGCTDESIDIHTHRSIMGSGILEEDQNKLTSPLIFTYPASPHLAAELDNREVDLDIVSEATRHLKEKYGKVLIEGAGGLMVPLRRDYLTIDYIRDENLPVVLTVNGRLGSINDTILSLEALSSRGIKISGVIYNPYFDSEDQIISRDTKEFIKTWVKEKYPETIWFEMPAALNN